MKSLVIAVVKPGCPACERVKPELAKLTGIMHVDADQNPTLVEDLSVQAFPDIMYKSKGKTYRMPWPSDGNPTASSMTRWIQQARAGMAGTTPTQTNNGNCSRCGPGGEDPKKWGPPVWFIIHMVALMYPRHPTPQQRLEAQQFFRGLYEVLPCETCKQHFGAELNGLDPSVWSGRDALFAWTVAFHDKVTARVTGSVGTRHSVGYWKHYYKMAAYKKALQQT